MEENTKKRYTAFISYRHCEPDSFIAINLEKKLETLKLPKNIKSTTGIDKIGRIFRDEDELPVASSLSEQIEYALKESEYLIALCSPRYLESRWCQIEINTFIELYGREKILLVLVDGEPSEAFPEPLTKIEVKSIDSDGNEIITQKSIEPLAADVRGATDKERKKKLDDVTLRLTAAILGINYDDLKQRNRERKMKRTISIVSTGFVCMLVFSLVCLGMLFRIQKQSAEIQEQNAQIQEQNDLILEKSGELAQMNEEIAAQYNEIAKKYAVTTAEDCLDLIALGRKKDAVYALRKVLPDSQDDTSVPYTSEARYALSEALELYSDSFINSSNIDFPGTFKYATTNNNDLVAVIDSSGFFYIYDLNHTDEPIFSNEGYNTFSDNIVSFIDNDTIIFQKDESNVVKFNLRTNEETVIYTRKPSVNEFVDFCHITVFSDVNTNYYVIAENDNITIFDKSNDQPLKEFNFNELFGFSKNYYSGQVVNACVISDNSKYICINILDITHQILLVFNTESGQFDYMESNADDTINYSSISNDGFLTTLVSDNNFSKHTLSSFDLNKSKNVWKINNFSLTDVTVFQEHTFAGKDCLVIAGESSVLIIDKASGEIIKDFQLMCKIAYLNVLNDNCISLITDDCQDLRYLIDTEYYFTGSSFKTKLNLQLDQVIIMDNGIMLFSKKSNYGTYFKKSDISDSSQLYFIPSENISSYNDDFTYAITYDYDENNDKFWSVYDMQTGKFLITIKGNNNEKLSFVGNGNKQVVLYNMEATVYNIDDASKAFNVNLYEDIYSNKCISVDKSCMYSLSSQDNIIRFYSLYDGKIINEIPIDKDSYANIHDLYVPNDTYALWQADANPESTLFNIQTGDVVCKMDLNKSYTSTIVLSQDGKYFVSNLSNGTSNLYKIDDDFTIAASFNFDSASITNMIPIKNTDMYLLITSSNSYLLSEDYEIIQSFDFQLLRLDYDEKLIYRKKYQEGGIAIYTYPFYDYEDLIQMADDYLGNYAPSDFTKSQYSVLQ